MAKTLVAVIVCLSFAIPAFAAAPPQPKSAAAQTKPAKPAWSELTPAQQQVLAPLKDDWHELDTVRRGKWVKLAIRYPKMKPEQQRRLQKRMKDWAKLTPEQRRVAREKYMTIKKLPPEQRTQVKLQWEQYQQSLAAQSEAASTDASGSSTQQ